MKKTKQPIHSYIQQFYKGNILYFILGICETILLAATSLLLSWLMQQLIDLISGYHTEFTLSQLGFITLCLIIGCAFTYFIEYHTKPKFITKGISQYKEYVYEKITQKHISAFSEESTSTYLSALTNDIETIKKGYLENIFTMLECLLTFFGAMTLMLWYSPLLSIVAILLSLLPLIASILTGNTVAEKEKNVSNQNITYTNTLSESLNGFSVVKSFQAEAQIIRIFKENVQKLAKAECVSKKTRILVQMFASISGIIAQLGTFLFGAYLTLSGKGISAGITIAVVQLMNYVINPLGIIPSCISEWKAARGLIEKIDLALTANIREDIPCRNLTLKDSIVLEDLSFGYEPEKPVLKHINYTFEHGKKYAIVGASGSGKSTLLNLFMSSCPAYSGNIYYDDIELRNINSSDLYEIVSIIQQNVFVFHSTIQNNITMFCDYPEEQIDEAIRLSGLSSLIAEKGADYLCGENGNKLSGGEKQRISIARSLLKKSQLLLVDEATASLDTETAQHVTRSILNLKDITSIVVTHSLDESLLKQYDGILTLKNGSIIESGTFEELIAQKGYFYSLFTISQ